MAVVDVYNLQREKVSETELKDEVFAVPIKNHVLHEVVVSQRLGHRSGTAATKTRSKIQASGSKLWRQKGTGRARVGASSSPTRRGGGVAFGPSPRDYSRKVPRKIRKAALRMALTDKLKSDQLFVVEHFELGEIQTKAFVTVMRNFAVKRALIVTHDRSTNLEKSSKNVPWVKVMRYEGLNVYDLLRYDTLFLEQPTVGKIEEALIP